MITRSEIENARTPKGGYTRQQLEKWGVPWPPPQGWKQSLLKSSSSQDDKAPIDLDET